MVPGVAILSFHRHKGYSRRVAAGDSFATFTPNCIFIKKRYNTSKKYPKGQFPSFDLVAKISGKRNFHRYEPLPEKSTRQPDDG
ncbi:hypothetical protein Cylst_6564 (plasmid) [Cylindrospermum stagnale PCC 7417]|uniref:Uncharacterized protein n=1 Tax=Cylindrospermum stagnale PCC 7417 TaxID=56107 RepID=K9X6S1_9NOST|nr:hypothetical protein [Cylindrospermum stagnale]AFZ28340.1 hypothetical protein Cylst_6564 [Cylindrospermum stagnale PCC 7417]